MAATGGQISSFVLSIISLGKYKKNKELFTTGKWKPQLVFWYNIVAAILAVLLLIALIVFLAALI